MTHGTKPSRTLRFLAGVRDFWLILGIALVVLFALEGIYRAQQAIRDRDPGPVPQPPSTETIPQQSSEP